MWQLGGPPTPASEALAIVVFIVMIGCWIWAAIKM